MSYNNRGYSKRRKQRRHQRLLIALVLLIGAAAGSLYGLGWRSLHDLPVLRDPRVASNQPGATTSPMGTLARTTAPTASAIQVPLASSVSPTAVLGNRSGRSVASTVLPGGTPIGPVVVSRATPNSRNTPVPHLTAAGTPSPAASPHGKPTQRPLRKAGAARRLYIVKPGDTLYGISEATRIPLSTLAQANGLTPQSEVFIGQVLLIPTRTAPAGIKLPAPRKQLQTPRVRPLREYSPELVAYLQSRAGKTSVALYLSDGNTMYTFNPDARYLTASTVKVPIMLTQLSKQNTHAGNAYYATADLLAPMIVVGDNDVATQMFRKVGGKPAIESELRARGLTRTVVARRAWGLSKTTAADMAMLMRSLYYGERLDRDLQQAAIGLLGGVVEPQRWGVPEGLGASGYVAFKGGWLQSDDGWQVHQIGIAEVYGQNIVFAFFTAGQPGEVYGRETLEGAARILARRMATR